MYKSAKVKAREFMKTLDSELPLEATLDLPFGLVTELVYKLLLEHERDTRHCIIDNVQNIESEISNDGINDVINLDKTVHVIQNTNVGE